VLEVVSNARPDEKDLTRVRVRWAPVNDVNGPAAMDDHDFVKPVMMVLEGGILRLMLDATGICEPIHEHG